jgi:hypothetical protein
MDRGNKNFLTPAFWIESVEKAMGENLRQENLFQSIGSGGKMLKLKNGLRSPPRVGKRHSCSFPESSPPSGPGSYNPMEF